MANRLKKAGPEQPKRKLPTKRRTAAPCFSLLGGDSSYVGPDGGVGHAGRLAQVHKGVVLIAALILFAIIVFASTIIKIPTTALAAETRTLYWDSSDLYSYGDTYSNYDSYIRVLNLREKEYGKAYCANPSFHSNIPKAKATDYPVTEIENIVVNPSNAKYVRGVLWYGWGGPGFDASMWPAHFDGTAWTPDKYQAATHVLVADVAFEDGGAALGQSGPNYTSWAKRWLVGFDLNSAGTLISYPSALRFEIVRRVNNGEVPGEDVFDTWAVDNRANRTQSFVGFNYLPTGKLSLAKISNADTITANNSLYDLSGAWFHVYKDGDDWSEEGLQKRSVGWLETGSQEIRWEKTVAVAHDYSHPDNEYLSLAAGTYWVREEIASDGSGSAKGYALGEQTTPSYKDYLCGPWEKVVIEPGKTSWVEHGSQSGYWEETPLFDTPNLLLTKADAESSDGLSQGKATLTAAQFSVSYFDNVEGAFNESPLRTWELRTDSRGIVSLSEESKVSGDDFYRNANGKIVVPLGTYVIQETKAPEGYLATSEPQIVVVDGTQAVVTHRYEGPNVGNKVIRGGVHVIKIDHELDRSVSQGDATLAGAQVAITSENDHPVIVDGKSYKKGEVVLTLTSDASGSFVSQDNALPYGDYTAREVVPPRGYLLNKTWAESFQIRKNAEVVSVATLDEEVQRGGIEIYKQDAELSESTPQGNASLANTEFSIINSSDSAVVVNGEVFEPGSEVTTIVSDGNGYAATPPALLPYGSYILREKAAPQGYLHDEAWETFVEVHGHAEIITATSLGDRVIRGGISVTKLDYERDLSLPQGDAQLDGAVFSIISTSNHPVLVNGTLFSPGDTVLEIETNAEGFASSASDALPYGSYYVCETQAPYGYLLNNEWKQEFSITDEGVIVAAEHVSNQVMRGDVILGKVDAELAEHLPLGFSTLEGTEFEIINKSAHEVLIDGVLVPFGELVCTITTDKDGIAQTQGALLPYGSYEWRESHNPHGYLFAENGGYFEIREDGQLVDLSSNEQSASNQVIRGDIYFNKAQEDSMREMARVAFRISSRTTGESHIIVTDENGIFASALFESDMRTNANDLAIREDGTVDDSKLDPDAGVWFSGRSDRTTSPHDMLASFPTDSYLLEELPCKANEGRALITRSFTIRPIERQNGREYDLGTIDDKLAILIGTTLHDSSGSKVLDQNTTQLLIDTVAYENLTPNESYTLQGELHIVVDGEAKEVISKGSTTFVPSTTTGTIDVEFILPASLENADSLVAFERLFNNEGEIVATHEDPKDQGQTVSIVAIHTTLSDQEGKKEVDAAPVKLVDTITYTNLIPGQSYIAQGTLHLSDGTQDLGIIEGSYSESLFTASESGNGSVEVLFEVDASSLANKRVVAFEKLGVYDASGHISVVATHEDPTSSDQSVQMRKAPDEPSQPSKPSQPNKPTQPSQPKKPSSAPIPSTGDPFVSFGVIVFAAALTTLLSAMLIRWKVRSSEVRVSPYVPYQISRNSLEVLNRLNSERTASSQKSNARPGFKTHPLFRCKRKS